MCDALIDPAKCVRQGVGVGEGLSMSMLRSALDDDGRMLRFAVLCFYNSSQWEEGRIKIWIRTIRMYAAVLHREINVLGLLSRELKLVC